MKKMTKIVFIVISSLFFLSEANALSEEKKPQCRVIEKVNNGELISIPLERKILKERMESEGDGYTQCRPSVAMSSDGGFVAAWTDHRNGNSDIYCRRFNASGEPIESDFKVNDDSGNANQMYPSVAIGGNGWFVIAWHDYRNGDHNDIYAQLYNAEGTPQGSNFLVNDDTGTSGQRYPEATADGNGNFMITWDDKRNGNWDVYCQRFSADGTPLGINFRVNDDPGTSSQDDVGIASDEDGNFVVVWEDERNGLWNPLIYAQRYNASGIPQGGNFAIGEDVGFEIFQYDPHIGMDEIGNFVVAWIDSRYDGSWDIFAQRCDSTGTLLGTNFKVNDDSGTGILQYSPTVAASNNSFVIGWEDERSGRNIYAQRYNMDGTPQGNNFMVNDIQSVSPWCPKAGMAANGDFIIVWDDARNEDCGDIYGQRYNSDGSPIGVNFMINGEGGNVGINDEQQVLNKDLLLQNQPNPFSNFTTISFNLATTNSPRYAQIEIYNIRGQLVRQFKIKNLEFKIKEEVVWDGRDAYGNLQPSGIYLYQLKVNGKVSETKKMIILR